MRLSIVFFAFGVWCLQQQAKLPELHYAWILSLIVPALWLAHSRSRVLRYAGKAGVAVLASLAGFMWAASAAHVRMADALPTAWEGRDIEVIGVVASLPQPSERSIRFEVDIERVITPAARVPSKIVLSWWGGMLSPPEV